MATLTMNERRIEEVAMDIVGGYENWVMDGGTEEDEIDFDDMLQECVDTAMTMLPKEVKFVGRKRATQICKAVVDSFDA